MPKQIPTKLIYTVAEAESATGFPHRRIYDLINSGDLASFKVGRRRMITARALDKLVDRLEREAAPVCAA